MRLTYLGFVLLAIALAGCVAAVSPSPSAEPTASEPLPPNSAVASASPILLARCENPDGHYAVEYPADWYVAPDTGGSFGACSVFGRSPIANEDDPAMRINLLAQPRQGFDNPFGPLTGTFADFTVLLDESTTIGGREAWLRELELTAPIGLYDVGDLQTVYAVELANAWWLNATAISSPEEHPDVRAVLEVMLQSLVDLPASI
jgi:hypothetical protein